MKDITALNIARKVLKKAAQRHAFGANCYAKTPGAEIAFAYDNKHYRAYMEAYNTLTAMQMGLDGECDVLARDWDTPDEDEAWKCLDEKALGWRESEGIHGR